MAKTAAHNIAVEITGEGERKEMPFSMIHAYCIMDTGNMGMVILGDQMLGPRHLEFIIPGPQAHWAKIAFEKYFMATRTPGLGPILRPNRVTRPGSNRWPDGRSG
jgi:sulfide:quinone oxidoreductase